MADTEDTPLKIMEYVETEVSFDISGHMRPLAVVWADGTRYCIDYIDDIRQAAAMGSGGQGERYSVRIRGRRSHIFFERSPDSFGPVTGKWFVEKKLPPREADADKKERPQA